ncbi:GDSL esterase/lipase EXL3 [Heracleum sosnowskyi]|uniref:GDSL esterase/lipase EXL3 n=1 Tax=Heracleum sosnowskyi TaxID=360622 RepID=A0AAD8JAX3_9APIA|nr:GDSL esterase/lipase EXL3 [Heracleum sosnowskyi]
MHKLLSVKSDSNALLVAYCLILWFSMIMGSEALIKLPQNVTVPGLIVFGDSIADQGNNNNLSSVMKCNFPPYGIDFTGGLATGRFTNARTPSDMIAAELGIKELVPAYLDPSLQIKDLSTGVSFASGGTGYDPQTSKLVSVMPLSDQLEMFKEYIGKLKASIGQENTTHILSNSIFLVVAGSNDIANTYFTLKFRSFQYDILSYADLLIASASDFIQEIYKLGARRIGVFGVPPVGCLPFQRTLAGGASRICVDTYNQAAQMYNSKLSSQLNFLGNSLPQAKLVYVDIYNPLIDIIQNPQDHGFDVVDKGCCGTGDLEAVVLCNKWIRVCQDKSKHLFWDSYHPTEQGYKVLVNLILKDCISQFF